MKLAIEGQLKKPRGKEKYWGVGIPLIEIYSQGKSKKDALSKIQEAVEYAIDQKGFKVNVQETGANTFAMTASDFNVLMAFMLKQMRMSKALSFREIAQRLGSDSPNAYRRYEQGESGASLQKLAELMGTVSDQKFLLLKTS
jgi:hypothetical protein